MGKNWTRQETLIAFDLYCKIPFGKISKSHPEIIYLAQLLNRTPGAVAMKMCNLASHDPTLQKRGIRGLKNGSKIEGAIWEEFMQKGSDIILEAEQYLLDLEKKNSNVIYTDYIIQNGSESEINSFEINSFTQGSDREAIIKQRIGQNFFRKAVLSGYDNKCCITGINIKKLLIASHIKPWKVSDDRNEKVNPSNGLCLNALHDKAFDQGLITIDKNYRIIVSSKLKEKKVDDKTKLWLTATEGKQITMPDKFLPEKKFIEYHNDVIFQP